MTMGLIALLLAFRLGLLIPANVGLTISTLSDERRGRVFGVRDAVLFAGDFGMGERDDGR